MHRYVLKRLLMALLVLLGVAFVVFSIMALTPSTPGRLILGIDASQEAVDELNASLGYDKPFFLRFLTGLEISCCTETLVRRTLRAGL